MYKNNEEITDLCEKYGGYLPEPKNTQENDFIHNLPIATNFYLGLRRDNLMATWIWQRDMSEVMWMNWDSSPNEGAIDCSGMLKSLKGTKSKKWDNFVCGDGSLRKAVTLVCEREGKGT